MKLLITQGEFIKHNAFSSIVANSQTITMVINTELTVCFYCDIVNQAAFETLRPSLNEDSYADGNILIPKELL